MSYHFSKIIDQKSFEEVENTIRAALKAEGFGVLTEIDVASTLKNKIDVDFRPYKILGACNPHFAHKALSSEEHIGVFLPCNVVLQQRQSGIEVSAVNPIASMSSVQNPELGELAMEVQAKMKKVIDSI